MADSKLKERTNDITKTPKMSSVYLINDDYTTFDHVVEVLMTIFGKTKPEAEAITVMVHNSGKGLAGKYVRDVAITKAKRVRQVSKAAGYPLTAKVENE